MSAVSSAHQMAVALLTIRQVARRHGAWPVRRHAPANCRLGTARSLDRDSQLGGQREPHIFIHQLDLFQLLGTRDPAGNRSGPAPGAPAPKHRPSPLHSSRLPARRASISRAIVHQVGTDPEIAPTSTSRLEFEAVLPSPPPAAGPHDADIAFTAIWRCFGGVADVLRLRTLDQRKPLLEPVDQVGASRPG